MILQFFLHITTGSCLAKSLVKAQNAKYADEKQEYIPLKNFSGRNWANSQAVCLPLDLNALQNAELTGFNCDTVNHYVATCRERIVIELFVHMGWVAGKSPCILAEAIQAFVGNCATTAPNPTITVSRLLIAGPEKTKMPHHYRSS